MQPEDYEALKKVKLFYCFDEQLVRNRLEFSNKPNAKAPQKGLLKNVSSVALLAPYKPAVQAYTTDTTCSTQP